MDRMCSPAVVSVNSVIIVIDKLVQCVPFLSRVFALPFLVGYPLYLWFVLLFASYTLDCPMKHLH
jgi:hypothetical protein